MKQRGINRIVIGTWDHDGRKQFFEHLLGATFVDVPLADTEAFGLRVSMAFDAGIELTSPLEGAESALRSALEADGEGIVGVVFAVEDADAARDAAAELGHESYYSLDYSQEDIDRQLGGAFSTYKEHFLAMRTPIAGSVLLGEFVERRS